MKAMEDAKWSPSESDYVAALTNQNPWHRLGKVPRALAWDVRRPLARELWRTLIDGPQRFEVILGPRRVGKTVGLYQTIQKLIEEGIDPLRLWFLRLDHPLLLTEDLGFWVRFLIDVHKPTREKPLYLFLDEVNYSRNWDRWLKTFYDEQWPVQIVATSSSAAALRDRTVESGIGRWSEQFLTPYTFGEYLDLCEVDVGSGIECRTLFETLANAISSAPKLPNLEQHRQAFMLVGGFPELLLQGDVSDDIESRLLRSQQTLRSEAVQRVTGMDIPQVFDIKNPLILERLLYVLAGQIGGLMNISHLANSLDISRPTVPLYISYLERAFLVFTLPNYSPSEESVQRKGKKVYFVDGAVRNAALQRGIAPLSDPHEMGVLVENIAAAHLYALSLQTDVRLFHWRNRGSEVDLIYDHPSEPMAFEVTASSKHSLKGLHELMKRFPVFKGRSFLVSAASGACVMPEDASDGVGRVPLDAFLLAASAQIGRSLRGKLGLGMVD